MSCYQFLAIVRLPKMVLKELRRVTSIACVLFAQWVKTKVESRQIQVNWLCFSRCLPRKFFKIYVSQNAFQAIFKPIYPYSITSILSKVRHSNTLFFAINFSFTCHPLCALVRLCVLLWHSLGRLYYFLKFFDC